MNFRRDTAAHYAAIRQARNRTDRWAATGKAWVEHPKYGVTVVPCLSTYSAVLCAAEVWKCRPSLIMDAKVWKYEGEVENDHQRKRSGQGIEVGL